MKSVVGVDLGTSYFKVGIFSLDGELLGLGRVPAPTLCDGDMRTIDAKSFWHSLHEAMDMATNAAGISGRDIQAVSYSSQANTFILLDRNDQPLTPLISWSDKRVRNIDDSLRRLFAEDDFLSTTGIGNDCSGGLALAKLMWIRKNEPGIWRRVDKVMSISDYLVYALTGVRGGDESTAQMLAMWDVPNRRWWRRGLACVGLDEDMLSTPSRSGEVITTTSSAGLLGLSPGVPLVAGTLDHHASAIGAGLGQIAQVAESTGTVQACICYCDSFRPLAGCCVAAGVGDKYYRLAFDNYGASMLEQYQRNHAPEISIDQLVLLAQRAHEGAPAGPHGAPVLEIMNKNAQIVQKLIDRLCDHDMPAKVVSSGGGAKSQFWLRLKTELIGSEFIATKNTENASKGAAMLAARAVCDCF